MNTESKWTLVHGIHRGTLTSRDSGQSTHNSLEECRAKLQEHITFYKSIGYVIWYAYAKSPDGTETILHPGNSNYR